ncbi:MAG: aminotransferase class IV [Verrucomicrobiae bacterium]|nr:aminotransferase class IV [Verrucomicrobiae bacterium]
MKREPLWFLDGRVLPASEARLPLSDLAVMRGFALFESLRTYARKPFLLDRHLDRLFREARHVGFENPYSRAAIERIVTRLLRHNPFPEAIIRLLLTGGPSSKLVPSGRSTFAVLVEPLPTFPVRQYEKGVALMSIPFERAYPEMKTTNYFAAVWGTMRALRKGFDEIVYARENGDLLEGSTFNLFAVLPGPRLVTPKKDVLAGVTAGVVLELARARRIPVERRAIRPADLRRAREIFITSSNREIIPVRRVDRRRIGNGAPGRVTRCLHAAYQAFARTA